MRQVERNLVPGYNLLSMSINFVLLCLTAMRSNEGKVCSAELQSNLFLNV